MYKILANDGVHPDGIKALEAAGCTVDTTHIPQAVLPSKLNDYDVIIVRSATKVRQELIDQCPNLKIICRGGVGMDNIDVEYAREKGLKVFNTPAASSQSVAELVLAHMLTLARSLHRSNQDMPGRGSSEFKALKKDYSKTGGQLRGKSIGIIGLGRIGSEVARLGVAMGMKVIPVDLRVKEVSLDIDLYESSEASLTVKLQTSPFEVMLEQADFITLHVPFSGGKPIIGKNELHRMKKGAYIINAARGGAVDENALLDALNTGKIAGAGLDVFVGEPSPRVDLLQHPNVSVSPHIGGSTKEAQRNIGLELADQIIAEGKA